MQEFRIHDYLHLYKQLENFSKITHAAVSSYPELDFANPVEELIKTAEVWGYRATAAHLRQAFQVIKTYPFPQSFAPAQKCIVSARNSFIHESEPNKIVVLSDSAVSNRLKDIKPRLPESGKLFFQETVYCLRIEAFRATIVNAWAMCMDYIQEWIVTDTDSARLQGFNTALSGYTKKIKDKHGNVTEEIRIYDDIAEKNDFWESRKPPSERVVLDCVEQTVGEKLHRKMVAALDDRNQFAHANSSQLDLDKTKGYISSILDIVEHPKLQ